MNIAEKRVLGLIMSSFCKDKFEAFIFDGMQAKCWAELMDCAKQYGVMGLTFEAIEHSNLCPPKEILLEWLGQVLYMESVYTQYRKTITKLARFYACHNIKMLLFKGYGLSLNYPNPTHRPCGDIDIYLYGKGEEADLLVASKLGVISKQNEEKHSIFELDGITIENHSCLINYTSHPSLMELERYIEREAENSVPVEMVADDSNGFYIPAVSINAIYLPYHIADHFFHGDASLRQLCDWAFFVKKYHTNINWTDAEQWAKRAGFFKFYCCLNGIVHDYLGLDDSFLPNWPRDKKIEKRVLNEILNSESSIKLNLLQKVVRYFRNMWKFRLVYNNESILLASLRQAQAYALVKWNIGGKHIWDK